MPEGGLAAAGPARARRGAGEAGGWGPGGGQREERVDGSNCVTARGEEEGGEGEGGRGVVGVEEGLEEGEGEGGFAAVGEGRRGGGGEGGGLCGGGGYRGNTGRGIDRGYGKARFGKILG